MCPCSSRRSSSSSHCVYWPRSSFWTDSGWASMWEYLWNSIVWRSNIEMATLYFFRKHFYLVSFPVALINPWCLLLTSGMVGAQSVCLRLPSFLIQWFTMNEFRLFYGKKTRFCSENAWIDHRRLAAGVLGRLAADASDAHLFHERASKNQRNTLMHRTP